MLESLEMNYAEQFTIDNKKQTVSSMDYDRKYQ